MTLTEIVEQLRSCGYECEAGRLEDNVAFVELERLAGQYSHRNGETEPPTIEGWFWFDGHRKYTRNPDRKDILFVKSHEVALTVPYPMPNRAARKMTLVDELEGRWWGPIVPPWGE